MAKNKVIQYCIESYEELTNKVTWPTWDELENSAIVVCIASLLIALVVFLMDIAFKNLLELFYNLV